MLEFMNVFGKLTQQYGEPAVLLRGLRKKEDLR